MPVFVELGDDVLEKTEVHVAAGKPRIESAHGALQIAPVGGFDEEIDQFAHGPSLIGRSCRRERLGTSGGSRFIAAVSLFSAPHLLEKTPAQIQGAGDVEATLPLAALHIEKHFSAAG